MLAIRRAMFRKPKWAAAAAAVEKQRKRRALVVAILVLRPLPLLLLLLMRLRLLWNLLVRPSLREQPRHPPRPLP
jgi:hypothetical protein